MVAGLFIELAHKFKSINYGDRVATEKHNLNSRTFQDIFLALFQDFQANSRTFPGLFTEIKNFD